MKRRKFRQKISGRPPELAVNQILAWADEWHQRIGKWPKVLSGRIPGGLGLKWVTLDNALRVGVRGLLGGSSLARLLARHRAVRNRKALPRLTRRQILAWADAHHQETGKWPTRKCGPIAGAPGETWTGVDAALWAGLRGLPKRSSLPRLLAARRGVRNLKDLPPLSVRCILAWADAHHRRTGKWPTESSGPVRDACRETWLGVDMALRLGRRGFSGGSSLHRLLNQHRGKS